MSQHSKPYISTSFSYETLEETLDVKPKSSMLLIGVPKETAFQENRIGLTPEAATALKANAEPARPAAATEARRNFLMGASFLGLEQCLSVRISAH